MRNHADAFEILYLSTPAEMVTVRTIGWAEHVEQVMMVAGLFLLAQERLVLLLCFDERFLEEVRICDVVSKSSLPQYHEDERTVGVGEADGKRLRLWLALGDVGRSVPHPTAVATDVW